MGKLKVTDRIVIYAYVVDSPVSCPWTYTCIQQVGFFSSQLYQLLTDDRPTV